MGYPGNIGILAVENQNNVAASIQGQADAFNAHIKQGLESSGK